MRKKFGIILAFFLLAFVLVGCKEDTSKLKAENAKKAVQVIKDYYKSQHNQSYEVSSSIINYYVWENDNKYYVLALGPAGAEGSAIDVSKNEFVDVPLSEKSVEQVINEKYKEQKILPDYEEVNNSDIRTSLKASMRELE